MQVRLEDVAIVVDPLRDDVAVAKCALPAGTLMISERFGEIVLHEDVQIGHRFAVRKAAAGQWVKQYGQPFAVSRGLAEGNVVNERTTRNVVPRVDGESVEIVTPVLPAWEGERPTFMGFRRADGTVGVRNWVLIVPTSMCSSHEAAQIAARAEMGGLYTREKFVNVDGVTAIPHTRGCGCPDYEPGVRAEQMTGVVEASMRMLGRYIAHPNVGAVLVIELGCEKTNLGAVGRYVRMGAVERQQTIDQAIQECLPQQETKESLHPLIEFGRQHGKVVATMSVQQAGGTRGTIERGLEVVAKLLAEANKAHRQVCDASALCLGLKCGGSDAFSGLSANPALGVASDLLIRAGGSSLITEIPEFFGAEHLFAARARNREVARSIFAAMERFKKYVERVGGSMSENPSPGNREGGLMNITIKSLGALAKSGRAAVEGVVEYGESIWEAGANPGLRLLYCPSYDQESVPALVASGCQIVCFTTGRGTGIGNAIAPVIKISSTSALYQRMKGDIDLDAGVVLENARTVEQVGREVFDLVLEVASGKRCAAEDNGHREFMIWSEEAVSL